MANLLTTYQNKIKIDPTNYSSYFKTGSQNIASKAFSSAKPLVASTTTANQTVQPMNLALAPMVENDFSDLNASVASANQKVQDLQKQIADYQKQAQSSQQTQQPEQQTGQETTGLDGLKDMAANLFGFNQPKTEATNPVQDVLGMRNEIYSALGITQETLSKANDLTTQINTYALDLKNLDNLEMQALNQNEKQYAGRLTDIKRGEDAFIQRDFSFKRADLGYSSLLMLQQEG